MKKHKKEYYGDVRFENEDSYDWASLEYWNVVPSKNGKYVQSKYVPATQLNQINSKYSNKCIKEFHCPDGKLGKPGRHSNKPPKDIFPS